MANKATIYISFTAQPDGEGIVSFSLIKKSDSSLIRAIFMKAELLRTGNGQYTIDEDLGVMSSNLLDAIVVDHYEYITRGSESLSALVYDRDFTFADVPDFLSVSIVEEVEPTVTFAITEFEFLQADENQNDNIKVAIRVNILDATPYYIFEPIIKDAPTVYDLYFDYPRYTPDNRVCNIYGYYGSGDQVVATSYIPKVGRYEITEVLLATYLTGTTATISWNKIGNIGYNSDYHYYSLDGVNYDTANSFDGLLEGTYIAYHKDDWGGISTFEFEVPAPATIVVEPYFDIPITNPLRFVSSGIFTFQTHDNTLFENQYWPNIEGRFFRQPFLLSQTPKTQIKTSYQTLEVSVFNCDGEVIDTITPELKKQNIELKDKRDCMIKSGGEGYTYIYFNQGNIYDPETDVIIDTYFEGLGRLPSFAQIGMYVSLTSTYKSGIYEITGIVYDEDLNAWVCVIDSDYPYPTLDEATCLSIYNDAQYNIYEFTLISPEGGGQLRLEINATDDRASFEDVTWISEPIYFANHNDVVTLKYFALENMQDVDYRTSIQFDLCIPGRYFVFLPSGEDEISEDDAGNVSLLRTTYVRTIKFESGLLPMWLTEKLIIATGHPYLYINDIEVVRRERPEIVPNTENNNPFYSFNCPFNEKKAITIGDNIGLVSSPRYLLGLSENEVIGI
jgi:hypothetical protein